MKLFKSKKGVFGLERIGWTQKHIAFVIIIALSAAFILEFTSGIVAFIVNFSLELMPFVSVRNILGFSLFILSVSIYLNQIDYRQIEFLGWTFTYWLFLTASILSWLWLFEPTSTMINPIMTYKLVIFPIISIRNAVGIILFILAYKIFKVVRR